MCRTGVIAEVAPECCGAWRHPSCYCSGRRSSPMNTHPLSRAALSLGLVAAAAVAANPVAQAPAGSSRGGCDAGNAGLVLPAGFCATVFADGLGHARQIAVAANGDVYVNTWSSKYTDFKNAPGGFVVGL